MLDIGHKLISPSTYACQLCSITHGAFQERDAWKQFRKSSSSELEFLHKDEFETQYQKNFTYPVILKADGADDLGVLLSTEEINLCHSIDDLIKAIHAASPS